MILPATHVRHRVFPSLDDGVVIDVRVATTGSLALWSQPLVWVEWATNVSIWGFWYPEEVLEPIPAMAPSGDRRHRDHHHVPHRQETTHGHAV